MTTNELRIGNWVGAINHEKPDLVPFVIESGAMIDQIKFIEHKPIPLTEEWLLKFGFLWDNITYSKDELMLAVNSDRIFNVWYHTLSYGKLFIEIKYVHQLQNLYFAVIGEELTVKK